MNTLVCISTTPETTAKIAFTGDGTSYDSEGVNYIMNPYDEWYALVRAIEIKEADGGEVHVIHVGPASSDIIIRKALAIGADAAFRVDTEAREAYQVAAEIAAFAKDRDYQVIFTGKETIDHNGAEVAGLLAGMLDLPFVSFANDLQIDGSRATVGREIEGGTEVVSVELPVVISAAKGLAEQRIANMRGIMMAKRKPLEVVQPTEASAKVKVAKYELPPAKSGVTMVEPDNMKELVRLLAEEAKAL